MRLDSIDQKLLNLLQAEFPLTRKPFADLGLNLRITEDDVIRRVGQLKANGLIRQIGPVFDARSLGYKTTLVAMRAVETKLDKAAEIIIKHHGVSHAYERDHHFNIWFTLSVPATVDMEVEVQRLTSAFSVETAFSLPAVKLFKLRAYFPLGGDGQKETAMTNTNEALRPEIKLSSEDRAVINEVQQDLQLVPYPFADMSARLRMAEEKFLSRCLSLLSRKVMRHFSAAVNHRHMGFAANAMTCWVAPSEKIAAAGQKLASLREVSHCYERKTNEFWQYNLFAMIHGHTKEACQEIAAEVAAETGLTDYVTLFSTREFKKTRVKYLV